MVEKIRLAKVTAVGDKVELPVPAYPFYPRNRYKVPEKQWRKWGELSRAVFNGVFEQMADGRMYVHPRYPAPAAEQWHTIRWNAAWIAADNVRDCLKTWAGEK